MDKKCLTCKKVKLLSEFPRDKNHKDGHRNICKECKRPRERAYKTKKGAQRKKIIDAIKLEKGCKVCGYNKHPPALCFHHREAAEKLFDIANARFHKRMSAVFIEIDKCDVLCANCHAEETYRSKSTLDTKK